MSFGPGPQNTLNDVAGLGVGQSGDHKVRTGVTAVLFDRPAPAAVRVLGGGPGTRETDLLASGALVGGVDALMLSGGSAFGLAAADGAAAALKAMGRGYGLSGRSGVPPTPIVPAAILYDLANGGDKSWQGPSPYAALGRLALERAAAKPALQLGRSGAGTGATAGAAPGGTGSASLSLWGGAYLGALAAVNCFGSVRMPGSDAFWAWPDEIGAEFGGARPAADWQAAPGDWGESKLGRSGGPGLNTTLAVVATDLPLDKSQCQRVADMASAGFARAIRPVFAPFDGDIVFAAATGERGDPPTDLELAQLGHLAAVCVARAIARGVFESERQAPGGSA